MVVCTLAAFMLGVLLANGLSAQQHDTEAKAGTHVVIRMTGELAKEYAKRTGSPARLVTLTGTIDPRRITTYVSPLGTL